MADKPTPEPKQKTAKGVEIPVPKRGEFFKNLKKVAPPAKGSDSAPRKKPANGRTGA